MNDPQVSLVFLLFTDLCSFENNARRDYSKGRTALFMQVISVTLNMFCGATCRSARLPRKILLIGRTCRAGKTLKPS